MKKKIEIETVLMRVRDFCLLDTFFMSLEYDILHITLKKNVKKKIIILSTSGVHFFYSFKFTY